MSRRAFLAGIAAAGGTIWSRAGQAQSRSTPPLVGVLAWGVATQDIYVEPFRHGLRDVGYTEGRDIVLDVRYAEGDLQRAATAMQELIRRGVDVVVAITTPAAHAAKSATSTIPIVMAPVADALATGLVSNLARPGGNITGVSTVSPATVVKALEALREFVPDLRRVGFLGSTLDPNGQTFRREAEASGAAFNVRVHSVMVAGPAEFERALAEMAREGAQAVLVQPIFGNNAARITEIAARLRLPTASTLLTARGSGGMLIGYGAIPALFMRQAAAQVDRILKGAKPGDLPVEQPTHFALAVNLKTAAALGLTIPPSLLARADEVIE